MSTRRIESVDNPRVKEALRLRERRDRRRRGLFLVEGAREITRALDAGHRPVSLFVEEALATGSPIPDRAARDDTRIHAVSGAVYAKLAVRGEAEGLIAIFPVPPSAADALVLGPRPLVLAVSGVEKPGNLGALLRSADAFGADAVALEGGTDPWGPNVVRASLGCLFTVPLAVLPEGELVPWLVSRGIRVLAASPEGARLPAETDLTGPVAILVGSEERGLSKEELARASGTVRIPMRGVADSLNVSVSAGVLLYEADRQRNPA